MSNLMNVSCKTRIYNSFADRPKVKQTTCKSMAAMLEERLAQKKQTEETAEKTSHYMTKTAWNVAGSIKKAADVTKNMTLEEYKQYIHDKISEIPLNPSRRQDVISIYISDAGFEAMKNDPEYEAWVLDSIRQDFAFYNPWAAYCGGNYCIKSYGATKEEYRGEMWSMGFQNGKRKTLLESKKEEESIWQSNLEKKKKLQKLQKKRQERKAIQRRAHERAVVKSQILHQKAISEYFHLKAVKGTASPTMLVNKTPDVPFISIYDDLFLLDLFLQ